MLERLMFWALIGHFVGDYLLQSKKTAIGKTQPGYRGVTTCIAHCWTYSLAVYVAVLVGLGGFSWPFLPPGFALVLPLAFLTHYPIDRWSLGDKWLKLVGGRCLTDGVVEARGTDSANAEVLGRVAATQAFAAIVYTVVDNTLHILLMLAGFAALLHWGVLG